MYNGLRVLSLFIVYFVETHKKETRHEEIHFTKDYD